MDLTERRTPRASGGRARAWNSSRRRRAVRLSPHYTVGSGSDAFASNVRRASQLGWSTRWQAGSDRHGRVSRQSSARDHASSIRGRPHRDYLNLGSYAARKIRWRIDACRTEAMAGIPDEETARHEIEPTRGEVVAAY